MRNLVVAYSILLACLILFFGCANTAGNEVYILPDNYTGAVIIKYGDPEGVEKEYTEQGERLFRIPFTGILKTKFNFQENWIHQNFYMENGTEIRYLTPGDPVWSDTTNANSVHKDSIYAYNATSSGTFLAGKISEKQKLYFESIAKWQALEQEAGKK
jgi:hypothetical protein